MAAVTIQTHGEAVTPKGPLEQSKRTRTRRWTAPDRARKALEAPESDRLGQAPVGDLTVNRSGALRLDVTPEEVAGYAGTFRITILNPLAWPVLVTLAACDPEHKLRFRIGPENPVVVPSRRSIGPIMVRAVPKTRVPWGPEQLYHIELRGWEPGREDMVTPDQVRYVRFTYMPPLAVRRRATWPPWVSRAIVLLLLLLALLTLSVFVAHIEEHAGKAVAARPTSHLPAMQQTHRQLTSIRRVLATTRPSRDPVRATQHSAAVARLPASGSWLASRLLDSSLVAGLPLPPTLLVNPTALRFGAQAVNTSSAARTVHMVNLTSHPLTISRIAIDKGQQADFTASTTCTGTTIPAYHGCEVVIRFTPTTPGAHDANLSISGSSAGKPYAVQLKALSKN